MSRKCCGDAKQPNGEFQVDGCSKDQASGQNAIDGFQASDDLKAREWVMGRIASPVGNIPQVATNMIQLLGGSLI